MSRVRTFFASLALASSLVGCAVARAEARSAGGAPAHVAPAPKRIMPIAPMVSRQQVRAKLAERRELTMQRFLAYREARVYPINSMIPGVGHVWLDENGNLCAAATLIAADWGREAAANIARANNSVALADVTEGELYDWILTSGMTKAELVSIQVPGFNERWNRRQEVERLYTLYKDVERQIRSLDKHNLDLAVDELMKKPQLARDLVAGKSASAGKFGEPSNPGAIGFEPVAPPAEEPAPGGFAKPPKG